TRRLGRVSGHRHRGPPSVTAVLSMSAIAVGRLVIRIAPTPSGSVFGQQKNPRLPARVPSVFGLCALARRPPCPSVLPPGAGNKAEKAIQPKEERANNPEERYVDQPGILQRHVHAAPVRPHDDGDVAAIPAVEQVQEVVSV